MAEDIWTEADEARATLIAEIACEISEDEEIVAVAIATYEEKRWQPIEDAPHGVKVLLYCPERGVANPERIELDYASHGAPGVRSRHGWATHYMLLPLTPVLQEPFTDG